MAVSVAASAVGVYSAGQTLAVTTSLSGGPIVVGILWVSTGQSASVSSLTRTGSSFTARTQRESGGYAIQVYTAPSCNTGSLACTATMAGGDGLTDGVIIIVELAGANGSFDGETGATGDTGDPTVNVTTVTGDMVIGVATSIASLAVAGSNHSQILAQTDGNIHAVASSKTGNGTIAMDWDQSDPTENWIVCAINAQQSATGVGIEVPLGSQPHTGRVVGLGFGINMPDQP